MFKVAICDFRRMYLEVTFCDFKILTIIVSKGCWIMIWLQYMDMRLKD